MESGKALMDDDVAHLAAVVGAAQKTLFVMDPKGQALTRIW